MNMLNPCERFKVIFSSMFLTNVVKFEHFYLKKVRKKHKQEYLEVKVEIYLKAWVEIRIPKEVK